MAEEKQHNENADAEASISDEQLEEASGGDVTLKRGYVSTDELWSWRKATLQEPNDEPDELKQGE